MSPLNRREFLAACGAAAVAAPVFGKTPPPPASSGPRLWIDPRFESLPRRPRRKIHLDFHNTRFIPRIGEKFDEDEFGDRLLAGNVDAVVVFAKDMHGYFYYPSRFGPVHPGLSMDLLGAEVGACRKRKIAVYAYYCTTWDNHIAETRPEWLQIKRDGSNYLPGPGETARWTALCLAHEPFVRLMLDHTREFVSRYELDGAWFDMPVPRGAACYCPECLKQMKEKGLDPFDVAAQHEHKHALHLDFIRRIRALVTETRPGGQVDFNGQGVYGLGERVPFMDNIDIEALPTAEWGYYDFPTVVRYTRNFGVTTYGMTGRFKASWADFGGLKLPAQLDTELAGIVANGALCDIGDQLPPSGRLDPAVYHVIGKSYGRIKALEPFLDQAAPVVEAALVTGGLPLDAPGTDGNYGLVKLLMESRVQFDVVEPDARWERYGLIILAEDMPIPRQMEERLRKYINSGNRVIAIHLSGLREGAQKSWLEPYGLSFAGMSEFKPAYLVPKTEFTGDIPPYEYALYEGASQWRAKEPAKVLARLGEPLFQRSADHFTSHAQTPFDHETEFAAMARSGPVALFGFPLGLSYFQQGYWVYRNAFHRVLRELGPTPLVESNAPLSTEIAVTHQPKREEAGRKERYLVHIVNFSPLRRGPQHPEFCEDPIPLTDVSVRLNLPLEGVEAKTAVLGKPLDIRRSSKGGVEVVVPRVDIHEIVVFELGRT
jgi:hypothetical protein